MYVVKFANNFIENRVRISVNIKGRNPETTRARKPDYKQQS